MTTFERGPDQPGALTSEVLASAKIELGEGDTQEVEFTESG